MADDQRFMELMQAGHACVSINTHEEQDALEMVVRCAVESGKDLQVWSNSGGVHDGIIKGSVSEPNTEHPAAALYHLCANATAGRWMAVLDLVAHLQKDERTLRQWRDLVKRCHDVGMSLIMIDHQAEKPGVVEAHSTTFELSLPDAVEIESIFKATLRSRHQRSPVHVDINRQDLDTVIRNLSGLSGRQCRRIILDLICDDRRFDVHDVNRVLARKRQALRSTGLLEYIESPVALGEIGGLGTLKNWLTQRQQSFGRAAREFGLESPRGVLMLGVQGSGKSLAAKAVATAWRMPLMRMDVGALYDRFIGESEKRLRDTLKQAQMMSPVILWIDEIEKAFASAASHSVDGGLSQRMFGLLLTWMQEHPPGVFTIATANNIDALPPELLRKSRFDEIFFVDLPSLAARAQIFAIHLERRKRDPKEFDIAQLAGMADGFSGAEIEQAIVSAMHHAFADSVELNQSHIEHAVKNSPPIYVTMRERIDALRKWAVGRCVPADQESVGIAPGRI